MAPLQLNLSAPVLSSYLLDTTLGALIKRKTLTRFGGGDILELMARHIVFLIHGIGEHKAGWASEKGGPIDVLTKASLEYAFFRRTGELARSLEASVEFFPLHYDDILDEAVTKWRTQGHGVLTDGAHILPILGNMAAWLERIPPQARELCWTHVVDIGIYWLLADYRQRIRTRLIGSIVGKIKEEESAGNGSPQCSVIAHSLGTIVGHDVIHALGATRWGGNDNPLGPKQWRFNALFMLANTSRLLRTDYDPYASIVRPGPIDSAASYCSRYYNIRHEFDPVPVPEEFSPTGWGADIRTIEVDHFRDVNIHGFGHYLLHPKVHIPILKTLVNPNAVTDAERDRAVSPDGFAQWDMPALEDVARRRLLAELSTLITDLRTKTRIEDVLAAFNAFHCLLQEIGGTPQTPTIPISP